MKYCNSIYAYNHVCNNGSSWNINENDFKNITGDSIDVAVSKTNGFYDSYSLINNNGLYWFSFYHSSLSGAFFWNSNRRIVDYNTSENLYGVRPIIKLRSSVIVVKGSGTYNDPYVIK